MSGIKFTAGSDDLMMRGAGSNSRSQETKRAGEGSKSTETSAAAVAVGKQSLDREAGKISVSDRATQVGKLVDKVKDAPDIRQERVEALRRQIESGEYNPPAMQIADAILKNET